MNYATYLSHIAPKRALWWLSGSQQSVWWEVQRPGLLCPSPATNQLSVLEIIFNLAGSLLPSSKISAIPSSHKVLWYCAFLSHRARSFDIREMMINCHQGTSASHRPESSESLVTTPLSHLAHILHLGRPLWLSFLCSLPEQRPLDGWPSLFLLSHHSVQVSLFTRAYTTPWHVPSTVLQYFFFFFPRPQLDTNVPFWLHLSFFSIQGDVAALLWIWPLLSLLNVLLIRLCTYFHLDCPITFL